MSTYTQPGNPQGETSFDVMDRNWTLTTVFWHDDLIRVQLWSEVIKQCDYSELRLIKTDSSNVYMFKDCFTPNLTVPPPGRSFPFYVYDATVEIQTGGAYGAPIPPGWYYLQILAEYAADGLLFDDKITVAIKYEDGSMPNEGRFLTFNETGKWLFDTNSFNYREYVYIEVRTEEALEIDGKKIEMAYITVAEIYGDKIIYKEIPPGEIVYVGLTPNGHVYRMGVDLKATIDGAQWFYGANWYPMEVIIEVSKWHWRPHPVFGLKKKKATEIAFNAANQIKITRPADLSMTEDDIVIYHKDGSSLDVNATITYGEELFINLTLWNLGDVDITNAKIKVWAVSGGVTLDFWELTSDINLWDPNDNGMVDNIASPYNYVQTEITWNTSKTGYDKPTLMAGRIITHVDIISPVIGGYGSSPIPEIDYSNNDAEVVLVPMSTRELSVSNAGYLTPSEADIGRMNFWVDKVTMSASGGGVRILGMNLTLTGTAMPVDIAGVKVLRDMNGNGIPDPGDYPVDSGIFVGGIYPVNFAMYVRDGRTLDFFFLYDIHRSGSASRTFGSSIASTNDIYVDPVATVSSLGFPINSDLATIMSNKNELTGVATGPAKVFAGFPALYKLTLNGFNTDLARPLDGSLTITDIDVQVTGSADVIFVWLLDHNREIISVKAAAPVVSFTSVDYTVMASSSRDLYVLLNIDPFAAPGGMVGITITAGDVTLSSMQDVVDPGLSLVAMSDIAVMADYFEWKVGDPILDGERNILTNIVIGSIDPTVNIYVAGLIIEWTSDMPTFTMRVYVDGVLRFEDDGINHLINGEPIPFITLAGLDAVGKTVRIEFDVQVTKMNPKKKIYNDNSILMTWVFGDGSVSHGGQYVQIDGFEKYYDIYWQII
jgi:hypothetical protein